MNENERSPTHSAVPLRRFYRYLSLATPTRLDWARECLVDSTIYFAQPSSFNDPFEVAFAIDYEGATDQWRKVWKRVKSLRVLGSYARAEPIPPPRL